MVFLLLSVMSHDPYVLHSVVKYFFFQVLASRTKIYIILEFITGGELFDKIVSSARGSLFAIYLLNYHI